ncbi:hypothetical protein VPH35_067374 [Triticum aestivum]
MIDWCADVLTAEALALRFDLLLAQKACCNRLMINSDNMEVIDTMKNRGHSARVAAAVFDDCCFMAGDFSFTSFEHSRDQNRTFTHELARFVKCSMTKDWFEEPMEILYLFL